MLNGGGGKSHDWITKSDKSLVTDLILQDNILFCRKVKDRELLGNVMDYLRNQKSVPKIN